MTNDDKHIFMSIWLLVSLCVCVCVCVRIQVLGDLTFHRYFLQLPALSVRFLALRFDEQKFSILMKFNLQICVFYGFYFCVLYKKSLSLLGGKDTPLMFYSFNAYFWICDPCCINLYMV